MVTKTTINNGVICVESDFLSLDEMLDHLNSVEGDLADAIIDVMPNDYNFIMNKEKYGILFALGSPQICECGWEFNYKVTSSKTTLTITNFR